MTREKGIETIIVLTLVSLIAYLKFNTFWLIYLALLFLTIGLASKKLTLAIGTFWFSFSHYFGLIMNYIIMFIIFFCILTPLSFFQRLTKSNKILQKKKNNTYFNIRNHYYTNDDIEKPW